MITTETEIRVALQAVLVAVLALYGFWGCAFVVLVILLPWKPILAVGGYLAQPLVDWRVRKAHERHGEGIAQIERELDDILRTPKKTPRAPAAIPATKATPSVKLSQAPIPRPLEAFHTASSTAQILQELPPQAQDVAATLAIPPAIKSHVKNLPQGAFSSMDLEIERVEFQGDTFAEAYVRFHSPNVRELVIRQRYVLKKSGEQWQVESRQPADGCGKVLPPSLPTIQLPMSLT